MSELLCSILTLGMEKAWVCEERTKSPSTNRMCLVTLFINSSHYKLFCSPDILSSLSPWDLHDRITSPPECSSTLRHTLNSVLLHLLSVCAIDITFSSSRANGYNSGGNSFEWLEHSSKVSTQSHSFTCHCVPSHGCDSHHLTDKGTELTPCVIKSRSDQHPGPTFLSFWSQSIAVVFFLHTQQDSYFRGNSTSALFLLILLKLFPRIPHYEGRNIQRII